ncbi:uncharacterized protein LOC116201942 isoform X2 [Punica granatum]|uniref:Uncharacterized protein LOC116201942 isoform X2 n=1 Tax=Punica granatum TaxID=22663 RepID=A0A6P8DDA5_PUNGR|nr:uncharacterized protein LOC116201942 isoform X2 [Punica granatum]XP_031389284.1 uncharacterized protein LOC116201942 isoform X2 [Punica granatum]
MSIVASTLILLATRRAIEIFPENVKNLWSKWQLRVLVLLSLSLQIILIAFGSRRKCTRAISVSFLVWMAYLTADSFANLSLGNISSTLGDDSPKAETVLLAFWAPFLLLHLGGPDTITAYSTEDNQLWSRHLLGLITQVGATLYIFLTTWSGSALTFLTIPMFVAGTIKYGERTWALRSASSDNFKVPALLSPTQFGIDSISPDAKYLHEAYYLFLMFKHLFTGVILTSDEAEHSFAIINKKSATEAFTAVEIELGFMYDTLYTKGGIVYSPVGLLLRFISFVFSLCSLILFSSIVDKNSFSRIDVIITQLLLVGAISLEVYALFMAIFSDWTMLWLTRMGKPCTSFMFRSISSSRVFSFYNKRWSDNVGQLNLITYCARDNLVKFVEDEPSGYHFMLKTLWVTTWEGVSTDMKDLIFQQLMEKHRRCVESGFDLRVVKDLLSERGDYALRRRNILNELQWCTISTEFERELLLWHIATDLCYYSDLKESGNTNCEASRLLANYMFHIQVSCPLLLPKWIGNNKYIEETYAQVTGFFRSKCFKTDAAEARVLLLREYKPSLHSLQMKTSGLVILDALRLAGGLKALVNELGWSKEQLWEMVCEVWVEILIYGAGQCEWEAHAQQLRWGGELLTHVGLLMAHLGITEQFQGRKVIIKIPERMPGDLAGRSIDDPIFHEFPA